MRPGRAAVLLATLVGAAFAACPGAHAQSRDSLPVRPAAPRFFDPGLVRGVQGIRNDLLRAQVFEVTIEAALSQRPFDPLPAEAAALLRLAQTERNAGSYARARETLRALDEERPHHPQILTERARLENAAGDYAAVERLGRAERLAARDSVLLARELVLALTHLARPREAAAVACEAWLADPAQEWVADSLERLVAADGRGVREVLRAAQRRAPQREDLALAAVRLEWRGGDPKEALRLLAASDGPGVRPPLRERFADDLLASGSGRDSGGATEALLQIAGDGRVDPGFRLPAARRAWELGQARGIATETAPRLAHALADLPAERWDPGLLIEIARALRRAGLTADSRALLTAGQRGISKRDLEMEEALADLRDGPPERALPRLLAAASASTEGSFRFAEALYFAGLPDSALAWYKRVADNSASEFAGAALERTFLIEDAGSGCPGCSRAVLPSFGRAAYEQWRGEPKRAAALTESLYLALPRGPMWARAALDLAAARAGAGDARAALEPLLALADSLPGDRLAPLARQRAGDLYLDRLKDPARAIEQYEECLARYPRSWNAAEVRRRLGTLRREGRL